MCGTYTPMDALADEQTEFYRQAQQESAIAFEEQQGMIAQFQSIYDPILAERTKPGRLQRRTG